MGWGSFTGSHSSPAAALVVKHIIVRSTFKNNTSSPDLSLHVVLHCTGKANLVTSRQILMLNRSPYLLRNYAKFLAPIFAICFEIYIVPVRDREHIQDIFMVMIKISSFPTFALCWHHLPMIVFIYVAQGHRKKSYLYQYCTFHKKSVHRSGPNDLMGQGFFIAASVSKKSLLSHFM